jgi:hypothetical protein
MLTGKRRFRLAEHVGVSAVMNWSPGHTTVEDMQIRKNFIAPLLLAAGVAAAIAAAPTAMAATANPAPAQPCINGVCPDSHTSLPANAPLPGNVQLNNSPGPVPYSPQYPYAQYPYDEGSYVGGYGGFGGGGFGGGGGHR